MSLVLKSENVESLITSSSTWTCQQGDSVSTFQEPDPVSANSTQTPPSADTGSVNNVVIETETRNEPSKSISASELSIKETLKSLVQTFEQVLQTTGGSLTESPTVEPIQPPTTPVKVPEPEPVAQTEPSVNKQAFEADPEQKSVQLDFIDSIESQIIQTEGSASEQATNNAVTTAAVVGLPELPIIENPSEPEVGPSEAPVPTSHIIEKSSEQEVTRLEPELPVTDKPAEPEAFPSERSDPAQNGIESRGTQIRQENIKQALNEIISEIDRAVVEAESDLDKAASQIKTPIPEYSPQQTSLPEFMSSEQMIQGNTPSQPFPSVFAAQKPLPSLFTTQQQSQQGFGPQQSSLPAFTTQEPTMPEFTIPGYTLPGEESDGSGIYYTSDHICSVTTQYNTAPTTPVPFVDTDSAYMPAYTEPQSWCANANNSSERSNSSLAERLWSSSHTQSNSFNQSNSLNQSNSFNQSNSLNHSNSLAQSNSYNPSSSFNPSNSYNQSSNLGQAQSNSYNLSNSYNQSNSLGQAQCSSMRNSWSGIRAPSPVPFSDYFLTRPSRVVTPTPDHPAQQHRPPTPSSFTRYTRSGPEPNIPAAVAPNRNSWPPVRRDQGPAVILGKLRDDKGVTRPGVSESPFPRQIDLEKLFTPAQDFSGDLTARRKMYGSSSFYSESHPTVEEQVDMARKISQSLTDATNQTSKGQSMYVKRKKKSVKWIHEGPEGSFTGGEEESSVERSGDDSRLPSLSQDFGPTKPLMKLVMNPRGHVQDWQSLKQSGMYTDHGALSPEICFDLVKDLHSPTGRGAQLFAKRRKKSEKWIVDETNVRRSSTDIVNHNVQGILGKSLPTTPKPASNLPPTSFIDRSRMEHACRLNQIQERFGQPKLRLVKSPWEAALETGSVDGAFEDLKPSPVLENVFAAAERKLHETPLSSSYSGPKWPPADNQLYQAAAPKGWESSISAPSALTNENKFASANLIEPLITNPTQSPPPTISYEYELVNGEEEAILPSTQPEQPLSVPPLLTQPLSINIRKEPLPNAFDVKRKFFENVARGRRGLVLTTPKSAFARLTNGDASQYTTAHAQHMSTNAQPITEEHAPLLQSATAPTPPTTPLTTNDLDLSTSMNTNYPQPSYPKEDEFSIVFRPNKTGAGASNRSSLALTEFGNYNTAPRGFAHGQSVYRPIMFS